MNTKDPLFSLLEGFFHFAVPWAVLPGTPPSQPAMLLPTCPQYVAPNSDNFIHLNTAVNCFERHHVRGQDTDMGLSEGLPSHLEENDHSRQPKSEPEIHPTPSSVCACGTLPEKRRPEHHAHHAPPSTDQLNRYKCIPRDRTQHPARGPRLTVQTVPTFGNKSNVSSLETIWKAF
jgi:hypothetical protein